MFSPARPRATPARILLTGPPGSGKSLTALRLACAAGRVAAVDAERGSLHHYAGMPDPETARPLDYDEARLAHDAEATDLIRLIEGAAAGGYEVLVIDGISHLWRHLRAGVDNASRAADGWGKLNAAIRRVMDAIHAAPLHIIVTARTATTWTVEAGEDGRVRGRPVGGEVTMDAAICYEVDTWISMDGGEASMLKCRPVPELVGKHIRRPGPALAAALLPPRPASPPDLTTPAEPVAPLDAPVRLTTDPAAVAEVREAAAAAARASGGREPVRALMALWGCDLGDTGRLVAVPEDGQIRGELVAALKNIR